MENIVLLEILLDELYLEKQPQMNVSRAIRFAKHFVANINRIEIGNMELFDEILFTNHQFIDGNDNKIKLFKNFAEKYLIVKKDRHSLVEKYYLPVMLSDEPLASIQMKKEAIDEYSKMFKKQNIPGLEMNAITDIYSVNSILKNNLLMRMNNEQGK